MKNRIIVGVMRSPSIMAADRIHIPDPLWNKFLIRGTRRKIPVKPYITVGTEVMASTIFFKNFPDLPGLTRNMKQEHPRLMGRLIITASPAIQKVPAIMGKMPNMP